MESKGLRCLPRASQRGFGYFVVGGYSVFLENRIGKVMGNHSDIHLSPREHSLVPTRRAEGCLEVDERSV